MTAVVGAWADLDFHQIDPTDRDVAFELAYRRVEVVGLAPTMLAHTGNGLQVWWLFHQPATITDEWPAERFEAINRGISQRLGGDHVHDLARVLRVPGTMNLPDAKKRQRRCVTVMSRLLDASGPTYRPEDLNSYVASTDVQSISAGGPGHCRLESIIKLDDEVVTAFQLLLRRLGPHHPLNRTWEGRRRLKDSTRSGFDWALAVQCARVGLRPESVAALMRIYGFGKGLEADNRYILRTVARAYAHESQRYAH